MTKDKIDTLFKNFEQQTVMVIGDVMIDAYLWGKVDRISPEAPVPVVTCTKREYRMGGAANVALNLNALGAKPLLCSVLGKDEKSKVFVELMQHREMDASGLLHNAERTTTVKTRIISNHQHLLRVDDETDSKLSPNSNKKFIAHVLDTIENNKIDAIIFEDYDKGVISPKLIDAVVLAANKRNIPTLVDPKKRNFMEYKGVTLFKPNFKELVEGLKLEVAKNDFEGINKAAVSMRKSHSIKQILTTLSELGVFISHDKEYKVIPAEIRSISDVSGAGDTVISVAALCLSQQLSPHLLAAISNLAGGLVCEKVGVVPIDKKQLQDECYDYFGISSHL